MIRSLFLSMQDLNKGARRPAAVAASPIRICRSDTRAAPVADKPITTFSGDVGLTTGVMLMIVSCAGVAAPVVA